MGSRMAAALRMAFPRVLWWQARDEHFRLLPEEQIALIAGDTPYFMIIGKQDEAWCHAPIPQMAQILRQAAGGINAPERGPAPEIGLIPSPFADFGQPSLAPRAIMPFQHDERGTLRRSCPRKEQCRPKTWQAAAQKVHFAPVARRR